MKRYIRASFNNYIPDWFKEKGLLQQLSRKGIDLANLTLTQDKAKRGSGVNQYIVYRIKNDYDREFVWIPGVYNDDEYVTDPYDRKYKAIKYVSKKNLPIIETWYINVDENQKQYRDRYIDPRYEYDKYTGKGKYAGQTYHVPAHVKEDGEWRDGTFKDGKWNNPMSGRDKSGYVIPKPSTRLMQFFNSEKGLKSLGNRLQDVYEDLIDMQEAIFRVDFTSFGKDRDGNPDYSSNTYNNMINEFGQATRNYRMALKYLNSAQKHNEYEPGYSRFDIREAFDYIKSIKHSIERITKYLETENDW